MSEHDFCRSLLAATMVEVRKHTTVEQRKAAWAYKFSGNLGTEFHGPDNYYHSGAACCLWAERSYGWEVWMQTLTHHITIGGTTWCEYTGSLAGQELAVETGINDCTYPGGYYDALEAADTLRPHFKAEVVEVVCGDCPKSIEYLARRAGERGPGALAAELHDQATGEGNFLKHNEINGGSESSS